MKNNETGDRPSYFFRLILLLAMVVMLLIGIQIGLYKGKELAQEDMTEQFTEAIESGKSVIIGKFIITPHRDWTRQYPVNFIWLKNNKEYLKIR